MKASGNTKQIVYFMCKIADKHRACKHGWEQGQSGCNQVSMKGAG